MSRIGNRKHTAASVELILEGSGHHVGQTGVNGNRRYWLKDPQGRKVEGTDSMTLDTLLGHIRDRKIA
jgi:hypothetical protein